MKRAVTVQIGGQRYSLKSDAGDDDVKRVAAYVDKKLKDLQRQSRTADTQALAVLVAMQVAEDLFREREEAAALKKKIRDQGRHLLQVLEREARL